MTAPIAPIDTGARNVTWRSRRLYRNICLASAVVCVLACSAAYIYWRSTTGG